MKPRILKKLSKKVFLIVGNKFGKVYFDNEEPFSYEHLRSRNSDQRKRHLRCTMRGIHVIGGGIDYFGEAEDYRALWHIACEWVLWEFGEQVMADVKDENGNIIDTMPDWPRYKKRLTGKEVMTRLREGGGV